MVKVTDLLSGVTSLWSASARMEITTRHACKGPRPAGRAGFYQAIIVGRVGAGLLPERTDPGQSTPRTRARRFTSHARAGAPTPTLPASPRPAVQRLTGGSDFGADPSDLRRALGNAA